MQNRTPTRVAHEAARIICEESLTDYRLAKQKAAQRLGFGPKTPMPRNAEIEAAVLEHQRLFGGAEYWRRLRQLRETALRSMRLLASFHPRLVGGVVSGAISDAHRVQLHAFCDKPELLDAFLHDRGLLYEQDEREFRFPDGTIEIVPLVCFEAGDVGVDVAAFGTGDERRTPLSPTNGEPMKRLTASEVEALAGAPTAG